MLRRARGLERHAVAGRDGVHQGHERQLHGVVPGAQHQHHAQGAGVHLRRGMEVHDGGGHAARLRPAVQVLEAGVDLVVDEAQLGGVAFERGFAEVGGQRGQDALFIRLEVRLQFRERLAAVVDVQRGAGQEEVAHLLRGGLDVGDALVGGGGGHAGSFACFSRRLQGRPSRPPA